MNGYTFFGVAMVTMGAVVILCLGILIGATVTKNQSYRQGQIDALTGQIKYELQTNEQGETTWQMIEEEDR